MCHRQQRSVKEKSIIIHHNQLPRCSFRTDELLTRGGHAADENHMRVKCDVYQLDQSVYKRFSTPSAAAWAKKSKQVNVYTKESGYRGQPGYNQEDRLSDGLGNVID